MWRRVPQFPGPLNQLVRKNMREILCHAGFLLRADSELWRCWRIASSGPALPPEAFMAMTVLVVGAMSSYAQCLFGLDGEGGLSRYRLLPVRGWQLLLAKDAAFLAVVIPLTLPLAVLPGIGAALVALAVGHAPAVEHPRPQTRWRFSTGGGARQRGDSVGGAGHDGFRHLSDERLVSGRGGGGVGGFAVVVRPRRGTRAGLKLPRVWRWWFRPADRSTRSVTSCLVCV